MLVLTRKTNQQIRIGENVVITILHVKGQSVRVGIEAPRQVRVVRSEIADLGLEVMKDETSMPESASSESSEAGTSDLQTARVRKAKSATKTGAGCAPGAVQTGSFSSPLGDRVTAVMESPTGEASASRPFSARPFDGAQAHGYHFQVGRCSALTTHPSGQRP